MKPYCIAISATDPSSGAGMPLDIRVLSKRGVYPLSVVSGVTIQDVDTFQDFMPVQPSFLRRQLDVVLQKFPSSVIKIGMIFEENVEELLSALRADSITRQIVFDPILGSSSGTRVLLPNQIADLIAHTFIVTPNIPEIEQFLDCRVHTKEDMFDAVRSFHKRYSAHYVLLKGGHMKGYESCDVLYDGKDCFEFKEEAVKSDVDIHGTGCYLSSSIAAYLALGCGVFDAIRKSKQDIAHAIKLASIVNGSTRKLIIDI